VNEYALYVKLGGTWQKICRLEAATHADALRAAGACLRLEHDGRAIRFQQERPDPHSPSGGPAACTHHDLTGS